MEKPSVWTANRRKKRAVELYQQRQQTLPAHHAADEADGMAQAAAAAFAVPNAALQLGAGLGELGQPAADVAVAVPNPGLYIEEEHGQAAAAAFAVPNAALQLGAGLGELGQPAADVAVAVPNPGLYIEEDHGQAAAAAFVAVPATIHHDAESSDEELCGEDVAIHYLEEDPDDPPYPDDDDPGYPENSDEDDDEDEDDNAAFHFSLEDESLNIQVDQGRPCTRREILLLNLAISSKHNTTYELLKDMLNSWSAGYGRPGFMPTSKKALRKLLKRSEAGIYKHAYCPDRNCQKYLGKLQGLQRNGLPVHCDCGRNIPLNELKWFLSISLKKQLQKFLAIPGIWHMLNYRHRRQHFNENAIEDIFDGELFKSLQEQGLISDEDFTFTFNSDGFALFKNRSLSVWVLLVRINDLPPNLRQRHVFLAGLWSDKGKPKMNTFLRPFVREVNHLSSVGLSWRPDNGEEITSKFFPLACCVDAQARCILMNMTQYNGQYGCFLCTHSGIHLGGSMKYPLLPYRDLPPALNRSDQSIRAAMANAPFQGQVGPSIISNLRHFDMGRGNGLDDLHAYFEGAAAFLFETLVPVMYDTEDALTNIDVRMKTAKTPIQISRKWTSIRKRQSFKGSQWGSFIRYFAPVCLLNNNLDEEYVEMVSMLSYSLFVTSRDSITTEERDRADEYTQEFLQRFQRNFGAINMRPNIHFLSHAINCVRWLGPTWVISCFNFESWNGIFGNNVTSPKGVFDQILDRHFLNILLREAVHRNDISDHIKEELIKILFPAPRKVADQIEESVVVLGHGSPRILSEEEQHLLLVYGIRAQRATEYSRVLVRGVEYRNNVYHPDTLSDNSRALTWQGKIVTIVSIVVVPEEERCVLFVKDHEFDHPLRFAHHVYHILPQFEICVMDPKSLRVPTSRINVLDDLYVMPMANCREID